MNDYESIDIDKHEKEVAKPLYDKEVLTDKVCPQCGNNNSQIHGHSLVHNIRVCLGCRYIYNK